MVKVRVSTGILFKIQRGALHDGPGLRTLIFFKGCCLRCPWCHNPEGQAFHKEVFLNQKRCLRCLKCLRVCPVARVPIWCRHCGKCADACPTGALETAGKIWEVAELVEVVKKDVELFKATGGGVTFSGGEAVAQPEFLFACAEALKELGIHLALETSGFWEPCFREPVRKLFDLILFDLKHVDPVIFRQVIGKDPEGILENLKYFVSLRKGLEVRFILVPGFNDSPGDIQQIAGWLCRFWKTPALTLLPFHSLGKSKYTMMGRRYPYAAIPSVSEEELARAGALFKAEGVSVSYCHPFRSGSRGGLSCDDFRQQSS